MSENYVGGGKTTPFSADAGKPQKRLPGQFPNLIQPGLQVCDVGGVDAARLIGSLGVLIQVVAAPAKQDG